AGKPWVDEVMSQVDPGIEITWLVEEGASVAAGTELFTCSGKAASILTAERTSINFLQTLSGTATITRYYADLIGHTSAKLLDTRKTIPGLRLAQKYAVSVGGGLNHRVGLFDAFLIKENHILAAGSIAAAIEKARTLAPELRLEIEVESLAELDEALHETPDWIMLDNFSLSDLRLAVAKSPANVLFEASGGIEGEDELIAIAETGVDFISMGAITKNCRAIDLSMRLHSQ
ncbi:MAG: carboxylating nicotinate-nucleotide diphosphorylase, partial [Pseudomonadales bacterium]|nr:carboxylating nicotinate-nucleotide diphosphorylase [Pseudomonadales bacterium]